MSPDDARHGTNAGYVQHAFRRIPYCQPCRTARAEHQAEYRRQLKLSALGDPPQWTPPGPLTLPERRQSLTNAARIRHRHPIWAIATVALDARAVPVGERWEWLDQFGVLVDRHALLSLVADSDAARDALTELNEGPWEEPYAEAMTRLGDTDREIDDMVREAQ